MFSASDWSGKKFSIVSQSWAVPPGRWPMIKLWQEIRDLSYRETINLFRESWIELMKTVRACQVGRVDDIIGWSPSEWWIYWGSRWAVPRIYGDDLLSVTSGTASNKSSKLRRCLWAVSACACVSPFMFTASRDCRVIFHNLIITRCRHIISALVDERKLLSGPMGLFTGRSLSLRLKRWNYHVREAQSGNFSGKAKSFSDENS